MMKGQSPGRVKMKILRRRSVLLLPEYSSKHEASSKCRVNKYTP